MLFLWLVAYINKGASPEAREAQETPRRRSSFTALFRRNSRNSKQMREEVAAAAAAAPAVAAGATLANKWDGPQLGLLDIYGFENLGTNSLEQVHSSTCTRWARCAHDLCIPFPEQLCINYANEILQKQFNERIFVSERAMYEEEGVKIDEVGHRHGSARGFGCYGAVVLRVEVEGG